MPDFGNGISATPVMSGYSGMEAGRGPIRSHRTAAGGKRLLDLDAGVLDHLAPAFLLAAHISIELLGRTGDHDEALVDAQPLESLGLNRPGGGFIEAVDHVGRGPGWREQAIPALRGVAGNAGLGDGR